MKSFMEFKGKTVVPTADSRMCFLIRSEGKNPEHIIARSHDDILLKELGLPTLALWLTFLATSVKACFY